MEELSKIHWHDSELISFIEMPAKDQLIFNVEYPEDWQANIFAKRVIVFSGFHSLEINEISFDGCPTILRAEIAEASGAYFKIRIETNAGYRLISAQAVNLSPSWQYA